MADLLIKTDASERSANQTAYNAGKAAVQAVVDNYNTLGYAALTGAEFSRLFNDTPSLIFDKATGGVPVTLGGLPVDKTKAIDMIVKPAGYPALLAAISTLAAGAMANAFPIQSNGGAFRFDVSNIASYFTLSTGSVVAFSTALQSSYDGAGKYYVKSDQAKAVFQFLQAVSTAYYVNNLHTYFTNADGNVNTNPLAALMGSVHYLVYTGQTFEVDRQALNQYDRG